MNFSTPLSIKNKVNKIFFITFFALVVTACKPAEEGGGRGFDDGGVDTETDDITDYSVCQGATPSGYNVRSNIWRIIEESKRGTNRIEITTRLEFLGATLRYSMSCQLFDKAGVLLAGDSAVIQPIADVTNNEIIVGASAGQTVMIPIPGGGQFPCGLELDSGRFPYEFKAGRAARVRR